MSLSIFSRACFRLSAFLSFLADNLFALTICLFRAVFSRSFFWLCFSALASGYLFSPHFLAGYGSSALFSEFCSPALSSELSVHLRYLAGYLLPRARLAGYPFSGAFLSVICFPALSCRLPVFPRFLAGYVSSR